MASIDKRPDGKWRARWREYSGGPQRTKHFATKRAAEAHLVDVQHDIRRGVYVDPALGDVALVDHVAAHIERQPWRYNTARNAAYALGHVRAHFGARPLGQTRTSDLQAFVSTLGQRLEPRTVATIWRTLRQAFRAAHVDGLIGRDPCLGVRLPRHEGGELVVPTDDEVRALHEAAPAGFAVAIVLAAGIGLRASEAAGLTEDRVRWLDRVIVVDRQWHGRLDRFEPVKYAASNRSVPISDEVLALLGQHIAAHGTGEHGMLLHANGRPLNSNRMAWRWERTARAAGNGFTIHELRHHYASSLIAAGCSIVAVQRALGHSKPSVTLDVYGHLMPSDSERIRAAGAATWKPAEDSLRTSTPRKGR